VLSWVEFIFALSGLLVFFGENSDLFLVECLAIKSFVHSHYFLLLLLEFRLSFFLCRNSGALRIMLWHLLNIVYWLFEFQIDISFNDADLVVRFAFDDVDQVVYALMVNIDRITLKTSRILGQLSFQNCFGIWKVDECSLVRLNLHSGTFEQSNISKNYFSTFFEKQLVHEPHR